MIARVVIHLPFSSRRVNLFRNEGGFSYPLFDIHQIAQVERRSVRRGADHHISQIVDALELACCVDTDGASLRIERLAAVRQVPRREQFRKVRRLELVLRQALLREIQKYVLAQHSRAVHFRHDRQRFQAPLNRVGEVVQIAIGVLVTCDGLQASKSS